jgi:hypothetical protein
MMILQSLRRAALSSKPIADTLKGVPVPHWMNATKHTNPEIKLTRIS